nr:peroxisomal N(1)-acetyl-spermine/spermidine oxidase-like isoform X1 [Procambarus clarkii]
MWRLIHLGTAIVAGLLHAIIMDQTAPGAATSAGPPLAQVTGHPCDQLAGTYHTWLSRAVAVDVVVVGGGVAGLTTLKTLLDHGVEDVILLEAQDYLGGRVRTIRQDGVLVEEGAEWIHGGQDNPLYKLASTLNALSPVLPDNAWDWRVVTEAGRPGDQQAYHLAKKLIDLSEEDGVLTPYYNASLGHFFIDKFNKTFRSQSTSVMKRASLHYLEKMVNLVFGTSDWLQVATRDADRFQEYGDDFQWKQGYDTLVTHLMADVADSRVRLSSPVCKIVWEKEEKVQGDRVLVVTLGADSYLARHVVVTTSVAHLQERHAHLFTPPLPPSFLSALMADCQAEYGACCAKAVEYVLQIFCCVCGDCCVVGEEEVPGDSHLYFRLCSESG